MATSQIKKFQKSSSQIISPWDLISSKQEDSNNYTITVIPGLLNNFLAQNWDQEFSANSNELYYAKAIVQTDGLSITNVNIQINTTAPTQQSPKIYSIQSNIQILFGLFRSGTVYRTVPIGQIFAAPRLWIRTQKESGPVNAGEIPFDEYYYLV